MSLIPSTSNHHRGSVPQSVSGGLQQRRGEMDVFRHGLKRAISVAKADIDLSACDHLIREAYITQLRTLELGIALAGDEPAALALLAEYLNLQLAINRELISRGSGGAVQ